MVIFLLRDGMLSGLEALVPQAQAFFSLCLGTVISIHPSPNLDFTAPITSRLRVRDSLLRSSADPSMLVESLLDLSQPLFICPSVNDGLTL